MGRIPRKLCPRPEDFSAPIDGPYDVGASLDMRRTNENMERENAAEKRLPVKES